MITSVKQIQNNHTVGDTMKMAVGFTLGIAVDVAVTIALGHLIPGGKGLKKILAKAGTFVIAMMAGEKAEEYVYNVIDETRAIFRDAQKELMEPEIEVVKVE